MFEPPPGSNPEAALHNARSFKGYHPGLAEEFAKIYPEIRLKNSGFPSLMPLLLSGKVPHAVMTWMMSGDNWDTCTNDLVRVHPLTHRNGYTEPNVGRFGVFSPFMDTRQDRPTLKPVPGKPGEFAVVIAQSSWTEGVLLPMMMMAGVDYITQIDGHSTIATDQLASAGIETINVTTAFEMLTELDDRGYIDNKLVNVICGVDLGNLPLVKTIREKTDFEVAMMSKKRVAIGEGEKSKTVHEFIFGNVTGKRVILVDDMISSGGTLLETVKELLKEKPAEIIICATHAVFSGDYYSQLRSLLEHDIVKVVMTTNTIPLKRPARNNDKDLPYIRRPGEGFKDDRKSVQMLNVDAQMGLMLQAMMASKNTPDIRKTLSGIEVVRENPAQIFNEITGRELAEPRVTHAYVEGKFMPL